MSVFYLMFILQKKSNRLSTGMVFDEGSIDLNTRLVHLGISLDAQFPAFGGGASHG